MDRRPRLIALNKAHKDRFILHYGDILDLANLIGFLRAIEVYEIYHLAAQSHIALLFEQPLYTYNINALGTTRVLEAITALKLNHIRFYIQREQHQIYAVSSILFNHEFPLRGTSEPPGKGIFLFPVQPHPFQIIKPCRRGFHNSQNYAGRCTYRAGAGR